MREIRLPGSEARGEALLRPYPYLSPGFRFASPSALDRGRDKVSFAPPSEPDWQISCIRLSSWWLTFKKIGMPQRTPVLRKTGQARRSRYLAIGIDRFL